MSFGPTSFTMPTISCPGTIGYVDPLHPYILLTLSKQSER
jgi:hypothetical protein